MVEAYENLETVQRPGGQIAYGALKELTDKEVESVSGIRKWAFQYLQRVLDGCIQRCEGKRGALMDYM